MKKIGISQLPPFKAKGRAARWLRILATLALLGVAFYYLEEYRYFLMPKNFGVVEEGRFYRSGYLETWPLERLIRKYHLKRVLTLVGEGPGSDRREQEVLARQGIESIRIPMPGNGCGTFESLDRAADVIAEASGYPLLVHCAAGANRTGAAYAAYRMKHCGWTPEQAFEEIAQFHSPPRVEEDMAQHLRNWFEAYRSTTGSEN